MEILFYIGTICVILLLKASTLLAQKRSLTIVIYRIIVMLILWGIFVLHIMDFFIIYPGKLFSIILGVGAILLSLPSFGFKTGNQSK